MSNNKITHCKYEERWGRILTFMELSEKRFAILEENQNKVFNHLGSIDVKLSEIKGDTNLISNRINNLKGRIYEDEEESKEQERRKFEIKKSFIPFAFAVIGGVVSQLLRVLLDLLK